MEMITHQTDHLHQFFRLLRIHAGCRLIQKQQLRFCSKSTRNLQTALGTIRQIACRQRSKLIKLKDLQKLYSFIRGCLFLLSIGRQLENRCKQAIAQRIMHTRFDIIQDTQIRKQTDILEGTGNPGLVRLDRIQSGKILPIHLDGAAGRLIDLCQHVEHSCLAGAVRTDQAVYLILIDIHIQIIDSRQAAEINAKSTDFKNLLSFFSHWISLLSRRRFCASSSP